MSITARFTSLKTLCTLGILALGLSAPQLFGQANKPKVNNEKPGNRGQVKRVHPHALKLILQGKKEEAIAYLKETAEFAVNPEHTQMLLDIANGKSDTWKYDAKSWPWERVLPNTSLKKDAPTDKFTIAFGGGSGYVPENERVWNTIGALEPRAVLLLGDNVYIDDPETPEMQRFHYYRRQSQPEWMRLAKRVPIYGIWDDHDFTTNDGWGGPAIDEPKWKREVWKIFKENYDNPYYGGGDKQPGCWFDFWIGKVHFVLIDGRYYRESPKGETPSMLGPAQLKWLKKTLKKPATFTDDSQGEAGLEGYVGRLFSRAGEDFQIHRQAEDSRSHYSLRGSASFRRVQNRYRHRRNVFAIRVPVLAPDQSTRARPHQALAFRLQQKAIVWPS